MKLQPNSKPIEITQRAGESILHFFDAHDVLEPLELISSVECAEAISARPRRGKFIELRVHKEEINKTAVAEDFMTKMICQTSAGNTRVFPLKIKVVR